MYIFHFYSEKLFVNPGEHKQMVLKISCPSINYLEHTLITLTIEAPNRGQLEIAIKSPSGNTFDRELMEQVLQLKKF